MSFIVETDRLRMRPYRVLRAIEMNVATANLSRRSWSTGTSLAAASLEAGVANGVDSDSFK